MRNCTASVIQRIKYKGRWLLPSAFLPSASAILDKAGILPNQVVDLWGKLSDSDRSKRFLRSFRSWTPAEYRSARWRARCSSLLSKRGIGTPSYGSMYTKSTIVSNTISNPPFSPPSPSPSHSPSPSKSSPSVTRSSPAPLTGKNYLPLSSSLPLDHLRDSSTLPLPHCDNGSSNTIPGYDYSSITRDVESSNANTSERAGSCPLPSILPPLPRAVGPRKITSLGTFNTRTLKSVWKRYELVNYMENKRISVLAIQSHCILDKDLAPGAYNVESLGSYKFIYTSADIHGVGGVGFFVCNETYEAIASVTSYSIRVLRICLAIKSEFKNCMYSVYSPTACSDMSVRNDFFNFLSDCINNEPKGNMVVIFGDFNAVLPQVSLPSLPMNDNSNLFMEFLMANELIASNTLFQKRATQLFSFYGTNQRKTVLDYILIRTKWSRSCLNCNACLIPTVSSDHNALIGKFRWTLARKSIQQRVIKRDFSLLKYENVRQLVTESFKSSLHNSTDPLLYTNFVISSANAVSKFLPPINRKNKRSPWTNNDITSLRNDTVRKRYQFLNDKTDLNRLAMTASFLELSELYKRKHVDYIDECCKSLEGLKGDHQSNAAWKLIDTLTGRKSRPEGVITADSPSDRIGIWESHFKNLLSSSEFDKHLSENIPVLEPIMLSPLPLPEFKTGPFSTEELRGALSTMKSNRAMGVDQVPAELLKCQEIEGELLSILNQAYESRKPCSEWLAQYIIPVHKKGSLSDCNNYRGIALMSITAKLFNRLLLNRLKIIDPYLRGNQNGFRSNRSTSQQILALRRLIETVKMHQNEKLLAVFIDFTKAFDSINWTVMERILALYYVPLELVQVIMMMYRGSVAIVKTKDGESGPIPLSVGVLQGDTLAPYLFIIMVDYVMRNSVDIQPDLFYQTVHGSKRASSRGPKDEFLTDLDFADDIVLFPSSFGNAQIIIDRFVSVAETAGLRLNISETGWVTGKVKRVRFLSTKIL